MVVAIDTSVLVAWTVARHPFHERTRPWFEAIHSGELDGLLCVHALAELYSVLTKIPGGLSEADARLVIENLPNQMRVSPLSVDAYQVAVERCAQAGARSGAVFDALHLVAAERQRAAVLLTFNENDFKRLLNDQSPKIVVPPNPPSADLSILA